MKLFELGVNLVIIISPLLSFLFIYSLQAKILFGEPKVFSAGRIYPFSV